MCKAFHWYQWDAEHQRLYVVCFKPKVSHSLVIRVFDILMLIKKSLWSQQPEGLHGPAILSFEFLGDKPLIVVRVHAVDVIV